MAYSIDLNVIWLTAIRTSTRSCGEIQRFFNFTDIGHTLTVTDKGKDFYIILNVMNPYKRMVSIYYLENIGKKTSTNLFREWVVDRMNSIHDSQDQILLSGVANRLPKLPDYYVRVESLEKDIRNIPFIKNNMSTDLENIIQHNIVTNRYKDEFGNLSLIHI